MSEPRWADYSDEVDPRFAHVARQRAVRPYWARLPRILALRQALFGAAAREHRGPLSRAALVCSVSATEQSGRIRAQLFFGARPVAIRRADGGGTAWFIIRLVTLSKGERVRLRVWERVHEPRSPYRTEFLGQATGEYPGSTPFSVVSATVSLSCRRVEDSQVFAALAKSIAQLTRLPAPNPLVERHGAPLGALRRALASIDDAAHIVGWLDPRVVKARAAIDKADVAWRATVAKRARARAVEARRRRPLKLGRTALEIEPKGWRCGKAARSLKPVLFDAARDALSVRTGAMCVMRAEIANRSREPLTLVVAWHRPAKLIRDAIYLRPDAWVSFADGTPRRAVVRLADARGTPLERLEPQKIAPNATLRAYFHFARTTRYVRYTYYKDDDDCAVLLCRRRAKGDPLLLDLAHAVGRAPWAASAVPSTGPAVKP